jgi:hypothetical protein
MIGRGQPVNNARLESGKARRSRAAEFALIRNDATARGAEQLKEQVDDENL